MSTDRVLLARIRRDEQQAQAELTAARAHVAMLEAKLNYIKTLIESATAPVANATEAEESLPDAIERMRLHALNRYENSRKETIAEAAENILKQAGEPLSAIRIARIAMRLPGFDFENIDRARSVFSAVLSKDINSQSPTFWQVDRGAIGLAEWKKNPQTRQSIERIVATRRARGEDGDSD